MRTAEEEREYQRKKKAAQRARKPSEIADSTAEVLKAIPGPKAARPKGSGWVDSPRFMEALVSLPEMARYDAALRLKQLTKYKPLTVEMAIELMKPPKGDTAAWLVRQSHLRADRREIAAHRVITIEEATAVVKIIPTEELPDLLDAALAAVQSANIGIFSLRLATLNRATKVGARTRRDAARRWRKDGETATAKHGRKSKPIRVSLDQVLQAHEVGETYEPSEALHAKLDGSAANVDNPYGVPYKRERRKDDTYEDVFGLNTEAS